VQITVRKRGAPLDLIVAEAAIVANSTWGLMLAEHGVPGIYRSQASLAPGVKVRMGTKALPHAGIGVKAYSWATSPLRRYVDLVNQWQIIACARHGKTAALAAPFKPKDAELFGIISSFDGAYSAYNGYQAGMERFWTLKYLEQNGITELKPPSSRKAPAACWCAPTSAAGAPGAGRAEPAARRPHARQAGRDRRDHAGHHGTLMERLDDPTTQRRRPVDEAEDDDNVAGPIAIAVDVNDSEGASADNPLRDPARRPPLLSPLRLRWACRSPSMRVLLSVRFVAPERFNRVFQDTPLEVILVNARTRNAGQGPGHCPGGAGRRRRCRPGPGHQPHALLGPDGRGR
jgi:exoribonuclease-2